MASISAVYWRDIPAQVVVREGRRSAKRQLADRFQEAIDEAAMRTGAHGTDAYLEAWRKSDPEPCGDDLEAAADAAQARFETEYDEARLDRLVAAGGTEAG